MVSRRRRGLFVEGPPSGTADRFAGAARGERFSSLCGCQVVASSLAYQETSRLQRQRPSPLLRELRYFALAQGASNREIPYAYPFRCTVKEPRTNILENLEVAIGPPAAQGNRAVI